MKIEHLLDIIIQIYDIPKLNKYKRIDKNKWLHDMDPKKYPYVFFGTKDNGLVMFKNKNPVFYTYNEYLKFLIENQKEIIDIILESIDNIDDNHKSEILKIYKGGFIELHDNNNA